MSLFKYRLKCWGYPSVWQILVLISTVHVVQQFCTNIYFLKCGILVFCGPELWARTCMLPIGPRRPPPPTFNDVIICDTWFSSGVLITPDTGEDPADAALRPQPTPPTPGLLYIDKIAAVDA